MLYQAYQTHFDLTSPLRLVAQHQAAALWFNRTEGTLTRKVAAACEVISRLRLTHTRPAYGITQVQVDGQDRPVVEETVVKLPFGTLLRFHKPDVAGQPKVLLAAPLSGHFATLLRDTVRTLLQDHDVYVTDWHNARDVPLGEGRFGLAEYVETVIDFIAALGDEKKGDANLIGPFGQLGQLGQQGLRRSHRHFGCGAFNHALRLEADHVQAGLFTCMTWWCGFRTSSGRARRARISSGPTSGRPRSSPSRSRRWRPCSGSRCSRACGNRIYAPCAGRTSTGNGWW